MQELNVAKYTERFPRGEIFVKESLTDEDVLIKCDSWSSDRDTMIIMQLADIAKRSGAQNIKLYLPYFPYSRQDRATTGDTAFSLFLISSTFEESQIDTIETWDLHSNVAFSLFKKTKLINVSNARFVSNILRLEDYVIVFPDEGASKKRDETLKYNPETQWVQGSKTRDPSTGKISGFSVSNPSNVELKGKRLLIVDDICSGGGTFLGLKEELEKENPLSISLAITHFDNIKGRDKMGENFDCVYQSSEEYRDKTAYNPTIIIPYKLELLDSEKQQSIIKKEE